MMVESASETIRTAPSNQNGVSSQSDGGGERTEQERGKREGIKGRGGEDQFCPIIEGRGEGGRENKERSYRAAGGRRGGK
ncbi:Forkhead box protein P4, partial [Dissostichus eleginoides]